MLLDETTHSRQYNMPRTRAADVRKHRTRTTFGRRDGRLFMTPNV
jgi:hypothetical protein